MTKRMDNKCKLCDSNAIPCADFCMSCMAEGMIANKVKESVKSGDIKNVLINGIAGIAFQAAKPVINNVVNGVNINNLRRNYNKNKVNSESADPFVILGLNRETSTIKDVRAIQKKLATIYHSDKKTSGIDNNKMAQLNCAVEECIKIIKNR